MAELLIDKGADVNAKYNYGMTPLFDAANKDVAELLIANGADVNAKARDGGTPLDHALFSGHKDVVELLIAKGADVNANDGDGRIPLSYANKDTAELLINKVADVNAKDKHGQTLLFLVRNTGVVELLIAKGADVNAKDTLGRTPLSLVKDKDVAELLIAKGADLNATDHVGMTPLCIAAIENRKDIAELLIAKGAEVNTKDKDGNTPLHDAVTNMNQGASMAELLVAKGANENAKNNKGETPLQAMGHADTEGHTCENLNYTLDWNCANTRKEILAALLQGQTGKELNTPDTLKTYLEQFKGHSGNDSLRKFIIDLAQTLKPSPAIPFDAEAAAGRGTYIFKNAKSADDVLNAAKEYLAAIEAAPWVADYYFNLCTMLEKTAYSQQALHACKFYLVAAPGATDAVAVRQRIAGLQYAADSDKTKMHQRTDYIFDVFNVGVEQLYRFGGISGKVSDKDIVLKLFVDWGAAPPKYQLYAGCILGNAVYGDTHDLVSTDKWMTFCKPVANMHLVIKPEGEGFVEVSDASGGSIRATLDELFNAKQKTMAQALIFSATGEQGKRFYVPYLQGGNDRKRAGCAMYESDCNGSILKNDARALPNDFISLETQGAGDFGRFITEKDEHICASQFASKTGYHFGETE
jgi:ankyrin repeat protein